MITTNVTNSPIKIVFLIHMFLASWGMQGMWSPNSYIFYTMLLFLSLFWAIRDKESADGVEIALIINLSSILLDIITLIICFPIAGSGEKFSAGMAVLNLIARPFTSVVLYNSLAVRMGTDATLPNNFGNIFGNTRRTVYDDIDSGVQQSVPGAQGSVAQSGASFYSPIGAQGQQEKIPPAYHA